MARRTAAPRPLPPLLLALLAALGGVQAAGAITTAILGDRPYCPDYSSYSYSPHPPLSAGKYKLPYQRPEPACRTFNLTEVEDSIESMRQIVKDPDLFRLFENCFPNTLDTAITWRGMSNLTSGTEEEEELTYITTGDINAMWLRDSANQLQSYKGLLRANSSRSSLASLFRGAINLQARYIRNSPYCNAFQAPAEAAMSGGYGGGGDFVTPPLDWNMVHECKYELDSLAAFLQLSHDYYSATGDVAFFARPGNGWPQAVDNILATAAELLTGTYTDDGHVRAAPYTFQRQTSTGSETLTNSGAGNPVKGGTGLVRSAFRPSDDSCIYQLFIPANMMFSRYLAACAAIMQPFNGRLAQKMADFGESIRVAIERHGRVKHAVYGDIYAYEVDGFGSHNTMDDANIPSLLSAPMLGYVNKTDPVYQNTRRFVLSRDNPYYMFGSVINGTGGPHVGTGMTWPMSLIVRILTTDDDDEIVASLQQLLSSTDGLGLIHESVGSHNANRWTRQWFSWANGLFGQMLLDLKDRKPHLLATSFQH